MTPTTLTLLTGLLCLLGGGCSIGRQIAYNTSVKTLQSAPMAVTLSMAPLALWAVYRGFILVAGLHIVTTPHLLATFSAGGPPVFVLAYRIGRPPTQLVHAGTLGFAAFLTLAEGAQLAWQLGQYLPPRCRARLNCYRAHVFRLARCASQPPLPSQSRSSATSTPAPARLRATPRPPGGHHPHRRRRRPVRRDRARR